MAVKRTPTRTTTRQARLTADIERWRNMKVVCVNEPSPERAARVMQIVVECNLRRAEQLSPSEASE